MQLRGGGPSWSYTSIGGGSALDRALYVRDACDLPVPPSPTLPPRVIEDQPRVSRMMSEQERAEAAPQWVRWWQALVDLQVRGVGGYATPRQATWRQGFDLPFEDVGSAPNYSGLADRPALHKAVLVSRSYADRWLGQQQSVHRPDDDRDSSYDLSKSLATAVIAERGVSPDLVRALVVELLHPDSWWSRWSPGVVIAGSSAMRDPAVARTILQSAYWSVI